MIKVKLLLIFTVLFSFAALAKGDLPFLSIKERLRLHLWTQGLNEEEQVKIKSQKLKILPEEIERPLRKL